jgi:hypothetical protein
MVSLKFSIFYFYVFIKIGGLIYVFNKMYCHKTIDKRSTFPYPIISYLTSLVPLIDYEKEMSVT